MTAQLLGQGTLRSRFEAMLQLRQADDPDSAFIADAYEFASGMSLHGHRRNDRNPHPCGYHRNNRRKLPALEDHIWINA